MIYINYDPTSHYSTVIIGEGDYLSGLVDYVRTHSWIRWVPGQKRTLEIQNALETPTMHIRIFVKWLKDNNHEYFVRQRGVEEGECAVNAMQFFVDRANLKAEGSKTKIKTVPTLEGKRPMEIKVRYFDQDVKKIESIEQGDWIDLRCAQEIFLEQGEFCILPLGVAMELPEGYEAHIVPRSSTFKKWGILQTNGVGIIDNSYSGDNDQWGMPVLAMRNTSICAGDRICQFRIMPRQEQVTIREVDSLGNTDRGGFGSTGSD